MRFKIEPKKEQKWESIIDYSKMKKGDAILLPFNASAIGRMEEATLESTPKYYSTENYSGWYADIRWKWEKNIEQEALINRYGAKWKPKVARDARQLQNEVRKEMSEHPWASKKTASRIAKDHSRKAVTEKEIDANIVMLFNADNLHEFKDRIATTNNAFLAFKDAGELSNADYRNINAILKTGMHEAMSNGVEAGRSNIAKDLRYFKTWELPEELSWTKHVDDSIKRFKDTHKRTEYYVVNKSNGAPEIVKKVRYMPTGHGKRTKKQLSKKEQIRKRYIPYEQRQLLREIGR